MTVCRVASRRMSGTTNSGKGMINAVGLPIGRQYLRSQTQTEHTPQSIPSPTLPPYSMITRPKPCALIWFSTCCISVAASGAPWLHVCKERIAVLILQNYAVMDINTLFTCPPARPPVYSPRSDGNRENADVAEAVNWDGYRLGLLGCRFLRSFVSFRLYLMLEQT